MVSQPGYDPLGQEVLDDPFPALHALREQCPVARVDSAVGTFYALTRYQDVQRHARDYASYSARFGQGPMYIEEGGFRSDPPEHDKFRRLLTASFTAHRLRLIEPYVTTRAAELVDELAGGTGCELISAFATPLPLDVITTLMGVQAEEHETFKRWTAEFLVAQNAGAEAFAAAKAPMSEYFLREIESRRALLPRRGEPERVSLPDDLVSSIVLAQAGDPAQFTDEQLTTLLINVLVGGNETTSSLIGNVVWRLLQDRHLWRDIVADPALVDVAIEESLRFDPPVLGLFRTVAAGIEVNGVQIPEGVKVQGMYAAANRDPAVFPYPDTFRLDRDLQSLRRHLTFGSGHHFCVGAGLSRMEAKIALQFLVSRFPRLALAGETERVDTFMLWGRKTLPVSWAA